MKKKFLIGVIASFLTLGLVGCGNVNYDKTRFFSTGEGYKIDRGNYKVCVDKETNNEYLVSSDDKVLIPFLDPEGKPFKFK